MIIVIKLEKVKLFLPQVAIRMHTYIYACIHSYIHTCINFMLRSIVLVFGMIFLFGCFYILKEVPHIRYDTYYSEVIEKMGSKGH